MPINSESPEEELRKKLRDGGNIASGAAVAPTTIALDEKTKTKEPNNLAGMDEGGAVIAPPTTNDDANDVVNAKSNQQLKRGVENSSPPLDEDVLKVRRVRQRLVASEDEATKSVGEIIEPTRSRMATVQTKGPVLVEEIVREVFRGR